MKKFYLIIYKMGASFTIGAFALIVNENNEVLLARRTDNGMWNLPGGGAESLESPWECVVREVREETKLDVKVNRLVGIYSKFNKDDLVFCFLCDIMGGTIGETDESCEFGWFGANNLPDDIYKRHKERILDFFKNKNKLTIKKS